MILVLLLVVGGIRQFLRRRQRVFEKCALQLSSLRGGEALREDGHHAEEQLHSRVRAETPARRRRFSARKHGRRNSREKLRFCSRAVHASKSSRNFCAPLRTNDRRWFTVGEIGNTGVMLNAVTLTLRVDRVVQRFGFGLAQQPLLHTAAHRTRQVQTGGNRQGPRERRHGTCQVRHGAAFYTARRPETRV